MHGTAHVTSIKGMALAAMLLALAPWPSWATDSLGVLSVAEPPGPSAELVEITGQLRAALAARVPGVLDGVQLRARMAGRPPPSSLAELDRAYAGALAAHAAGEYEAAVRTLRTVVEDLERLPEGPETFAHWTRAMFRLARSEQELGRGVEAQAVLEKLLRATPDVQADLRQFPPSFLTLVREARERLRSLGTRRLTVESQPDARVFVEGREVGVTPVALHLPPGRYRVAGLRGGVRAPTIVVDLTADDRLVQLDMSLVEVLRPDGGPGLSLPVSEWPLRIITAASRLALDRVVATSLLRSGEVVLFVATLHDARRGTVEREGRLRLAGGAPPPGGVDALATFLLTGQPSALVSTASGPSSALDVPKPRTAPPPALLADPTIHRHLGFYLHLDLGGGFVRSSSSTGGVGQSIQGGSLALGVAVGTALSENLILAGHVWVVGPVSPEVTTGSQTVSSNGDTTLVGMGPELTYYFTPSNVFVSACPAITKLTRRTGGTTTETDFAFGGYLAAGKEWWVADHWGLGIAAQLMFGVNEDQPPNSASTWTTFGGGLAFSATYH